MNVLSVIIDPSVAYKSCMREDVSFVHMEGELYYRISPRSPFVLINEYLQEIPTARVISRSGSDRMDILIFIALVSFALGGLAAVIYRLEVIAMCWRRTASIRKRRLSKAPPVEGGYSPASELPVYEVWGGEAHSKTSSSVHDYYDNMQMVRLFAHFGEGGGGSRSAHHQQDIKLFADEDLDIQVYSSIVNFHSRDRNEDDGEEIKHNDTSI